MGVEAQLAPLQVAGMISAKVSSSGTNGLPNLSRLTLRIVCVRERERNWKGEEGLCSQRKPCMRH